MRPQSLLPQGNRAKDDRITRAMAALTGPMQIEVLSESRTPTRTTTRYRVLVTPTHYGCNCPDWQYRARAATLCRHLVAAAMLIRADHHGRESKEVA
jgi:hypothetical protein